MKKYKILIASDIHGSSYYCKKLIDRINVENPDKVILLGDILYHGPRNDLPLEYNPKIVIELLNQYKDIITCVRGNCDSEVDQMVLNFPIMSDYTIYDNGEIKFFVTHGHLYNKDIIPNINTGDVLLNGHFHIPEASILDNGVFYINPGSISIPKNNSTNSYIIFENRTFKFKNIDGDQYQIFNI